MFYVVKMIVNERRYEVYDDGDFLVLYYKEIHLVGMYGKDREEGVIWCNV